MKVNVVGKELKVTDAINDYIERKLERIDKYFEDASAEVTVKTEKNEQIAEVMVNANGDKYRAEAEEKDLYASIDKVIDILEGQIRKTKTQKEKMIREGSIKDLNTEAKEETEVKEEVKPNPSTAPVNSVPNLNSVDLNLASTQTLAQALGSRKLVKIYTPGTVLEPGEQVLKYQNTEYVVK